MRAATGDIFSFSRDLLICFSGLGGRDECFSIAERLYCLWVCARRFLAKCCQHLAAHDTTRSRERRSVRHSRCNTITRRNRKKRPVRLSVPVATTVEQSSCSSLCPHSNALTSNSQLLLRLHLWPDQLANVAVALELVAALRTARAVCGRENAPVRKRLY